MFKKGASLGEVALLLAVPLGPCNDYFRFSTSTAAVTPTRRSSSPRKAPRRLASSPALSRHSHSPGSASLGCSSNDQLRPFSACRDARARRPRGGSLFAVL